MARKEYQTKSRKLILQYLIAEKEHTVSVLDIADFLKEEGEQVNISTIYRYLDKLVSEGKAMKYQAEKGKKAVFQYHEGTEACHKHLHLQCVKCGRMIHLDCGFMDEISGHMMEHHKFRLQCENSILYGMCHSCEKEQEQGK